MSASIDRVRKKVEDGERVSDEELELLRGEAQRDGSATARLAVAHALVNNGDAHTALALFEAVRRDFPRDVQARLGLARALGALERYSDAERALLDAVELNPGDPEALKGLAVVAMRRGELARAIDLVEQVLRVDPFDGEAQLIRSELDAQHARPAEPKALRPEFVEALTARLKQQSTPFLLTGDTLVVRLGKGGVARLDLKSLYGGYLEEGRGLAQSVDAIARELMERTLGVPPEREALLKRAMPVLRDEKFLERAVGAVRREGPAGLFVFYVLDDSSEFVRYLPEGVLDSHRVSLEELDAAAFANLDARPAQVRRIAIEHGQLKLAEKSANLWAISVADGLDWGRLLTPAQKGRLFEAAGEGPFRVSLAHRELVVLGREDDVAARTTVQAISPGEGGLSGVFRYEAGRLSRVST